MSGRGQRHAESVERVRPCRSFVAHIRFPLCSPSLFRSSFLFSASRRHQVLGARRRGRSRERGHRSRNHRSDSGNGSSVKPRRALQGAALHCMGGEHAARCEEQTATCAKQLRRHWAHPARVASNCALCVRVCAGFGRGGLLVGGVLGGATYAMMSGEGMDAIKSTLPLDKL